MIVTQFVRFYFDDANRFESLKLVFEEIKAVKNLDAVEDFNASDQVDVDYDIDKIRMLMPEDVQSNLVWPTSENIDDYKIDRTRPIRVSPPGAFSGEKWSLINILDLIDTCEYTLVRCELIEENIAELHVDPWAYPYGGLNALIALIEAFGFRVIGVNEYGKYEAFSW